MATLSPPFSRARMANSTYDINNRFGPVAPQYFDFTRLFEDSILSIGPSALFLCAVPFRLLWLRNKPRAVSGGPLHSIKLVGLALLGALQVICLALWTTPGVHRSSASIGAATLTVVATIALFCLSHMDHLRSIRPSAIINTYILISLPMDIASVRTLWTRGGSHSLAAVSTSTISVKCCILIMEAIEKRDILLARYKHYSPESTSSIYSRSVFWWLNPLLQTGFGKILKDDDLYPMDVEMKTDKIQSELEDLWAKVKDKTKKNALLWKTLWAMRWPLAKAVLPQLCLLTFQYVQPFLIRSVIKFLQSSDTQNDNVGWGLTAAYGLAYIGLAISQGAYMHATYRMATIARGLLVSMIYSQTVDLNVTSVNESAALTLMSTDVERITLALQYIHYPWSAVVGSTASIYLLSRQFGVASSGPILLSVLAGLLCLFVSAKWASKAQRTWIQAIQTRISNTSKMLAGMKAVKMLGLTDMMRDLLQGLREKEVALSVRYRYIMVVRLILGKGSEVLAPGIAFAAYAAVCNATGQTLDLGKAYSALNILQLMSFQIGQTIQCLPLLISAMSCFDRIQDFLNLPAQRDHRMKTASESSNTPSQSEQSSNNIPMSHLPPANGKNLIEVENASFAWNDSDPVIKDITFSITQNTFNFVVGPVGSGKSTLLKGLVGETPSTKGFVYSSRLTSGLVDQTSWIQNGTLRDNILGASVYERSWYSDVVHACCLGEDMEQLPKADSTHVGSAGISLSGGQKQRVALARAVYSKEKLLILDDCFSGLDATTEDRIFNRLLGKNGLLRANETTVILVTHAAHRLAFADNILVLDAQGELTEQGTFSSLMEHGQYLPTLAAKLSCRDTGQKELEQPALIETFRNPANEDEIARAAEDASRSVGDWSTYAYFFSRAGWLNSVTLFCTLALFSVFQKLPDVWITYWAAAVEERGNSVNIFYLSIFVLFEILSVTFLLWGAWTSEINMSPRASKRLHKVLLDAVMRAPLLFFTTTDTGTTLNRFSQDLGLIDSELLPESVEVLACICLGLIQGILMSLSSGYFTATVPLVLLVMWVVQKFYLRTSRQLRILDLEAKSPLYSNFGETLEGLVTIRAFGWSERFEEKNKRLLDTSQKPFYLLFCVQRWLSLVLDLTVAGMTIVLMVLVVKLRLTVNPGFAGLALVNVNGFNLSITELVKSWTLLETSMGAIARIKTFPVQTENENLSTENETLPNGDWPSKGRVEISNLWAGYKPNVPVVKNLTLEIPPGQKVGICGPSGSGKSSVIATIFRMLEISSGSVTIDGVDISRIPRQDLRAHINAIPQEAYMFEGSVRLNVDPLNRCTDEERKVALEKVQLWSIIEAKGGLDAAVDTEMFSHGQRQLFCLARAILHPSKVVVLDEVTSNVDHTTDELMQQIIRNEFGECTIICVAHRLDTIMDFDKIATLKNGELVEFDTPQVLMSTNSAFKALYNSL